MSGDVSGLESADTRHGDPGRGAFGCEAEVAGRGEPLELRSPSHAVLGVGQRVDAGEPVLVEVVVRDGAGVAVEISAPVEVAEHHLARRLAMPGQCDSTRTVPAFGSRR